MSKITFPVTKTHTIFAISHLPPIAIIVNFMVKYYDFQYEELYLGMSLGVITGFWFRQIAFWLRDIELPTMQFKEGENSLPFERRHID